MFFSIDRRHRRAVNNLRARFDIFMLFLDENTVIMLKKMYEIFLLFYRLYSIRDLLLAVVENVNEANVKDSSSRPKNVAEISMGIVAGEKILHLCCNTSVSFVTL